MIQKAKRILLKTPFFGIFRTAYRRLDPVHRAERRANRALYSQLVRPGDLCFDIGANLGQTIEALRSVGGVVIAVEPNPQCLPILKQYYGNDSQVTVVEEAVGAECGEVAFHYKGTNSTASVRDDWPFSTDTTILVPVTTLATLIDRFGYPQFLKVDVEGYELEVFKGLDRAIPYIYFEMHGNEAYLAIEILERLSSLDTISGIRIIAGNNIDWLNEGWELLHEIQACLIESPPAHANVIVRMEV